VQLTQKVELFRNIFEPHSLTVERSVVKKIAPKCPQLFLRVLLCRGGMNRRDFRQVSRLISETIQDIAIVTMEDE